MNINIETMQAAFDMIYSENTDKSYYTFDDLTLNPFLRSVFYPGAQALDLGCGDGRFALSMAKYGFSVSAVDLSPVGISKLEKFAKIRGLDNICCAVDNVLSEDLELGKYDLIVASTIMNHLSDPDVQTLVGRIKQAVLDGTSAYISIFTKDDPGYINAHQMDEGRSAGESPIQVQVSETASMLQYYFEKGELLDLFRDCGVVKLYEEGIEEDTSHGPPHYHGLARIGICGK